LRLATTKTLSRFPLLRYKKNAVTQYACHLTELHSSCNLNFITLAVYFLYNV